MLSRSSVDAGGCVGEGHATAPSLSHVAGTRWAAEPNSHTIASGAVNGPPVTVTTVPPRSGPDVGETSLISIGSLTKNCRLFVERSTPLVVTSTPWMPADIAGVTQVTCELVSKTAGTSASFPKRQASRGESTKPEPWTSTTVLPDTGPICGLTEARVTVGWYSNVAPLVV